MTEDEKQLILDVLETAHYNTIIVERWSTLNPMKAERDRKDIERAVEVITKIEVEEDE